MGDEERCGGGEPGIKELKKPRQHIQRRGPALIMFCFKRVAAPCKWPRSFACASHFGLSNGPQRKEMVSDRQPGPPKAGVTVYTYPPQLGPCSSWEQTPVPLETHA